MTKIETILNYVNGHIESMTQAGGYYVKSIDCITAKGAEVTFGHPCMVHEKNSLKFAYIWMGTDHKELGLDCKGWKTLTATGWEQC
jgi:hypothetical protein